MNILHINSFSSKSKSTFPHIVIHDELLRIGKNSQVLSYSGDYVGSNVSYLKKSHNSKINFSRYIRKLVFFKDNTRHFYPEWNLDLISTRSIESKLLFKPDLIIVYWSKFFFNSNLIHSLAKKYNSTVFYYLLDMAHLSGGCHYSKGCNNYQLGCGNCPALVFPHIYDISKRTFSYKRHYITLMNPGLIIPSNELMKQTSKSLLWRDKKQKKILLSVDGGIFYPSSSEKIIKIKYKLAPNDKVILFAASKIDDPRKGFKEYHTALTKIIEEDPKILDSSILLFLGSKLPKIDDKFKYTHIDYTNNQQDLADIFRLADIYVNASIEDSGPLLLNQAVMSGLPIVSFDTGVASDLIEDNINGLIAKDKNSDSLAASLIKMLKLNKSELEEMKKKSRDIGIKRLSVSTQVNEILSFYSEFKFFEKEV